MRRRTRWRRECFAPVERPQPHPAASCPGSGEQRRPFGEGPPQDGGCGVPGAGLRPGRAFVRQGGWGCGPQWPRPRPGAGSGPEPRRGRSAFPAGSRSRKGRCLAPRPVRRPCRPGLRVLAPARPESWPSVSRAAETAGPLGLPLPRRPEKAASGRKTPMSASAKGSRGTT